MATGHQQPLAEWLNSLDLRQHHDKFSSLGLSTIGQLKEFGLDDSFLNDLGISNAEHRQRILHNISNTGKDSLRIVPEIPTVIPEDENVYENFECSPPVPKENEIVDDDIYVNYSAAGVENVPPKPVEKKEGGEVKKKPVPRPRLSKIKKEQKERMQSFDSMPNIPQSPQPVASPRRRHSEDHIAVCVLPDATTSESSDDFDPFSVKKNVTHSSKYSDELLNMFNSRSDVTAERPTGFPVDFVNNEFEDDVSNKNDERLSDSYDAIWVDSNATKKLTESPSLRKGSDSSPFTPPFLPRPCHSEVFNFKDGELNENTENSENDETSYKAVERTPKKINRQSNRSQKHIYVNDESPPPPSFPPPALPPEEDLPPVPPRTSSDSNKSITLNSIVNRANVAVSKDEILYSDKYVKKGLFTSTKLQTLKSTSGPDPFNGQDPFNDLDFEQECQQFNQPGADNIFAPEEPPEQAFDPFGIYELQKQLPGELERVPPVPDWDKVIEQPKAVMNPDSGYSLYSLAAPFPQDNSSDGDDGETSDGELSEPSSPDDIACGQGQGQPAVDVILTSPFPRKAKQKSGYLWKQGGVKANRGWRKRWVVFDTKTLRYYPNHKSQISKRIIPVACMNRVEICVKDKSTDRFKFNLITQNRTFLFAAETLNECTLWANTLMEAIINYEKPHDGEKEGGEMYDADKMGFVKFERKREMFVAIKGGKLCYYDSHQDYKMGMPLNEIDMKLASVKEVGKNKLQLSTHYGHFILLFTDKQDCVFWKMAIEDSIADGLGDNTVLDCVRENPSNRFCADCRAPDPHWASINIGVVLCKNCAGIHRDFDCRVSRVKSLRMDTKIWTPSLIEMMKSIGNENANKFWESRLQPVHSINNESSPEARKQYIQDKYQRKLWIDQHPLIGGLNQELLRVVVTDNILDTMKVVFSGANVLFTDSTTGKSAFELAKDAGQRMQTEFLYHNGGDKTSRASADIDEALALRMRAEITMEGHLLKTGPKNRNVFMDRYCVIEHGCLRYFVNDKSSTARDSIDNESMLCVQAVTNIEKSVLNLNLNRVRQISVRKSIKPDSIKRYPNAFELSTTKSNNRTYLFAASTPEEKMAWMRTLSKLFCPIHFIKEMPDQEFSLAGNFYVKAGVASEWQKTWILVDKKVVRYINEEQTLMDIDLRKVSNIQYVEHAAGQPCSSAAESGRCFTIDIPGRSLYFQADLQRDTERLYEAFGNSMKGGGPTIEDQQLTPENVPVIVHKCIKFIEENGLKEEGVYRQAAVDSRIQALLSRFLADAHSLSLGMDKGHTVNEVANCLKRFFRQLKDPLFTKTGYQDWIRNAARDDVDAKLTYYKFQINQLPTVNKCTVRKLILHLASLATHCADNKMDVKNIALAFGSTLMKGGAESIHQQNLPLEMRVVEDLITYHSILFEEEIEEKKKSEDLKKDFQKRLKLAEMQRESMLNPSQIEEIKVAIHLQHRSNKSEDFTAKKGGTVGDAVDFLKRKLGLTTGQWVLYEVVISAVLERPLHPSECLLDVVMSWSNWGEEYRKNTHLVLKSADRLKQLDEVYDPKHALFAEFKYKEKKGSFKTRSFGFNQSKLSLFKESGYNTQPAESWRVEDMYIYFGADQKKNAQRYAFSFYMRGEKVGSKELPMFGRTICCTTENELVSWMAAMLKAKHPDGYLS